MALTFAVLGDSIAYGQGAARSADTAGARLAGALERTGTPVDLLVVAVPGAVSGDLAAQVRAALVARPDLALIIVGANDLTHFVAPHQAADALRAAVRQLHSVGVEVVVAPAPDLSVVPWVPTQMRAVVKAGSVALRQAQTAAALAEGARVATSTAPPPPVSQRMPACSAQTASTRRARDTR